MTATQQATLPVVAAAPFEVCFFVPGPMRTKGSARAFVIGGKARITNDNPKAKAAAAVVTLVAQQAMAGRAALLGPVRVEVEIYLPRPKSHHRSNGQLKPTAPTFCPSRPDLDKLLRNALDALTGVVFVDDAQVVTLLGVKRYASDGRIGARFVVAEVRG